MTRKFLKYAGAFALLLFFVSWAMSQWIDRVDDRQRVISDLRKRLQLSEQFSAMLTEQANTQVGLEAIEQRLKISSIDESEPEYRRKLRTAVRVYGRRDREYADVVRCGTTADWWEDVLGEVPIAKDDLESNKRKQETERKLKELKKLAGDAFIDLDRLPKDVDGREVRFAINTVTPEDAARATQAIGAALSESAAKKQNASRVESDIRNNVAALLTHAEMRLRGQAKLAESLLKWSIGIASISMILGIVEKISERRGEPDQRGSRH